MKTEVLSGVVNKVEPSESQTEKYLPYADIETQFGAIESTVSQETSEQDAVEDENRSYETAIDQNYESFISEAALIRQAKEGDGNSFGELYSLHRGTILNYLQKHTNSPEDIEDLVQTTFVKAFTNLEKFEDFGEGMQPWLFTIARNSLIGQHRKEQTRERNLGIMLSFDAANEYGYTIEPPDYNANPEQHVVDRLVGNEAVEEALQTLNPNQRNVVFNIDIVGATQKGCAQKLGLPIGTVQSSVGRGRSKLRKRYESGELARS